MSSINLMNESKIISIFIVLSFYLLFSVFGIPIIIDEVYSEEREEIIDDLLNQVATKPVDRSNDFQISDNDLHMYINYAQTLSVAFDSRAIIMLKNYFMATKMIRPGKFLIFHFYHVFL